MKNNTAILDCVTKLITFKYLGEIFTVDIKEGDLSDSWNTITDKNGVMWDFNFSWEDDKTCNPSLWLYALKKDDCDNLTTDTSKYTIIKIGKASLEKKMIRVFTWLSRIKTMQLKELISL